MDRDARGRPLPRPSTLPGNPWRGIKRLNSYLRRLESTGRANGAAQLRKVHAAHIARCEAHGL